MITCVFLVSFALLSSPLYSELSSTVMLPACPRPVFQACRCFLMWIKNARMINALLLLSTMCKRAALKDIRGLHTLAVIAVTA